MKKIVSIIICLLVSCIFASAQNTYVVVIGIANYPNVNQLVLPGKDAKAVSEFYKEFTPNVITLTGKYATKAAIIKALKDQFSRATENDAVVFFFSGHGFEGGLCPYDIKPGDQNTGLWYEEVQEIFYNCKAKRKIVFADACFAGGLTGWYAKTSPKDLELLLFLASRYNETSMELPFMTNGVFTTYLLRGLRGNADENNDGTITAKELFSYVSRGAIYKTNDRQHPVMWGKFNDNMILNK